MTGYDRADVARCWAGFASLGAGLVHLAVTHDHYREWWLFGVFFAVLGGYQVAWAVAAMARRPAPLPALTVGVNTAVVALWALTRTVGLPFGPGDGAAEAVGRADVLSVVLEVGVVAALVVAGAASRTSRPVRTRRSALGYLVLMGAGAMAVSAITTPALAATGAGGHAHGHGGGSQPHGVHSPG
ncbi:MAG: hypothetical protein ACRDV1_00635 [Actinomycetes bacterium]